MIDSCKRLWVWLIVCLGLVSSSHAEKLTLGVAANFVGTLKLLCKRYQIINPSVTTEIISASTGKLLQQVRQGAPYDIIFLANDAFHQPKHQDLVLKNSITTYALGQLVFISRKPRNAIETWLSSTQPKTIAMANPNLAPYGQAALDTIAYKSINTQSWQIIQGNNINQTLQFFLLGGLDGVFMAESQITQIEAGLKHPLDPKQVWRISSQYHRPIVQTLGINQKSQHSQAAFAFIKFLKSSDTQQLLQAQGYRSPQPKQIKLYDSSHHPKP